MRDVEAAAGSETEFSSWQDAVHEVVRALRREGRVAVTGVWGAGKTTLLAEVLGEVRDEDRILVRVTCADEDRAHVFGGVAQLLSQLPSRVLAGQPARWRPVVERLLRRSPAEPAALEEISAARLAVAGLLRSSPASSSLSTGLSGSTKPARMSWAMPYARSRHRTWASW